MLSEESLIERKVNKIGASMELSSRPSKSFGVSLLFIYLFTHACTFWFYFILFYLTTTCYNENAESSTETQNSEAIRPSSAKVLNGAGDDGNKRARGMVLPFRPLSISFDEIRYAVDMPPVHLIFT